MKENYLIATPDFIIISRQFQWMKSHEMENIFFSFKHFSHHPFALQRLFFSDLPTFLKHLYHFHPLQCSEITKAKRPWPKTKWLLDVHILLSVTHFAQFCSSDILSTRLLSFSPVTQWAAIGSIPFLTPRGKKLVSYGHHKTFFYILEILLKWK